MNIIKTLTILVTVAWVCIAQTNASISGKVTDTSGVTPIAGAAVKLENNGLTAITDADGKFTLTSTGNINTTGNKLPGSKVSAHIRNGLLFIDLREKGSVEIITCTPQGKVISGIQRKIEEGTHSMALPHLGAGLYLYKIKSGNCDLILKGHSIGQNTSGSIASLQGTTSTIIGSNAKCHTPINDVIAVTKAGYLNYRVIVTNSDTSGIEIKMIVCADTVQDADGNVYQAVRIGNQIWTVENLKTTKYNDGTPIARVSDDASWQALTTGAYCYYGNNARDGEKYGALYNWYAVGTDKLAPKGWRVPSDADWNELQNYLIANGFNWGGSTTENKIAKSMAAKTDWAAATLMDYPELIGNELRVNNRTGFSALPGGVRNGNGSFAGIGTHGFWWSSASTSKAAANASSVDLNYDRCYLYHSYSVGKIIGQSVRIVRNMEIDTNIPDNDNIELVYPLGGEQFKVGDTVVIQFKVNKTTIASVVPSISIDNGISWNFISTSVYPDLNGPKYQRLSKNWIIGKELEKPPYQETNSECRIKVMDFNNNTLMDQSAIFTIAQ